MNTGSNNNPQTYRNSNNVNPRTNGQGHYYQHDHVNDGEKNFEYHTFVSNDNAEADFKISGSIKLGDGGQINIGTRGNASSRGRRNQ